MGFRPPQLRLDVAASVVSLRAKQFRANRRLSVVQERYAMSQAIHRRSAATAVVAQPAKMSKTTSPGLDDALMTRS